jgi:hypothetical protein
MRRDGKKIRLERMRRCEMGFRRMKRHIRNRCDDK